MEVKVKIENGIFNTYNSRGELIGKIKIDSSAEFKESEIIIDNEKYKVIRNNWETFILDNDDKLYHLKTNSFSGNTEIKELNKKVKGIWGLKWGTQLADENGKTLLKIRNEKKSVNNGNYIIELDDGNVTQIEILISLYLHLYGSSLKQKGVLMGIIAGSLM